MARWEDKALNGRMSDSKFAIVVRDKTWPYSKDNAADWMIAERTKVRELEAEVAQLTEVPQFVRRAEAAEAELERARDWNEAVAVCAKHAEAITEREPCVVCDLQTAEAALARVRTLPEKWRKIYPRTVNYPPGAAVLADTIKRCADELEVELQEPEHE